VLSVITILSKQLSHEYFAKSMIENRNKLIPKRKNLFKNIKWKEANAQETSSIMSMKALTWHGFDSKGL
jgi:hypothetical protein